MIDAVCDRTRFWGHLAGVGHAEPFACREPIALRGLTLPNRIAVSPMCQYSAEDGLANDWHLVHLGGMAVGGAGLVLTLRPKLHPFLVLFAGAALFVTAEMAGFWPVAAP